MEKGTLAVEQIKELAQEIQVGNSETLLLEDSNQLVVIVKDKNEKVNQIKGASGIGISPFYIEELDILTMSIAPGADENHAVHFLLPTNEVVLEQLKNMVDNQKGIELYVISEDLDVIASRRIFTTASSCEELDRQLKCLAEARVKQQ